MPDILFKYEKSATGLDHDVRDPGHNAVIIRLKSASWSGLSDVDRAIDDHVQLTLMINLIN